jgi:3-deoxy-D-manno-octulosonate 8-phosphate phosphatase (KDO 8-P phosphatase)
VNSQNNSSKPAPTTERWATIKLVAFDVDGTLTDGSLTFDGEGRLYQTFNVRDGFGLVAARRAGLLIAWISGRPSPVAERRFEELGLHECLLACDDKAKAMRDLQEKHQLRPEECCFVGDDLPDLPAFALCGVKVAVADAVPSVLQHADYVTRAPGGRGAAREVLEIILDAQGQWQLLLDKFTRTDWTEHETENLQR